MALTEIRDKFDVLKEIKTELEIGCFDSDELDSLCGELGGDDFTIELDGCEYRFIKESAIEDIYVESIRELVEDCYLGGCKEIPDFLVIDWEETAQNCMADGYGHHFSHYDGSERSVADYYIFRTN